MVMFTCYFMIGNTIASQTPVRASPPRSKIPVNLLKGFIQSFMNQLKTVIDMKKPREIF